jgi:glycine betaine/choline ABC-type transport system substrate-binding protein
MRTDRVFLAPFAAFVALALAPAAAWAQDAPALERIVIGSKNFSESHLLGAMMAQLLEAHTGARVEHRAGLVPVPSFGTRDRGHTPADAHAGAVR